MAVFWALMHFRRPFDFQASLRFLGVLQIFKLTALGLGALIQNTPSMGYRGGILNKMHVHIIQNTPSVEK